MEKITIAYIGTIKENVKNLIINNEVINHSKLNDFNNRIDIEFFNSLLSDTLACFDYVFEVSENESKLKIKCVKDRYGKFKKAMVSYNEGKIEYSKQTKTKLFKTTDIYEILYFDESKKYKENSVNLIFGNKYDECGLMLIDEYVNLIKSGHKCLFVDTDNSYDSKLEVLKKIASNYQNVDIKNLTYIQLRDVVSYGQIHSFIGNYDYDCRYIQKPNFIIIPNCNFFLGFSEPQVHELKQFALKNSVTFVLGYNTNYDFDNHTQDLVLQEVIKNSDFVSCVYSTDDSRKEQDLIYKVMKNGCEIIDKTENYVLNCDFQKSKILNSNLISV